MIPSIDTCVYTYVHTSTEAHTLYHRSKARSTTTATDLSPPAFFVIDMNSSYSAHLPRPQNFRNQLMSMSGSISGHTAHKVKSVTAAQTTVTAA